MTQPRQHAPVRRSGAQTWVAILVVVVAVTATLALAFSSLSSGQEGPAVGREAPSFRLDLFGGGTLDSDALRGQVVVLNFWASWCPPCRAEAPLLRELWQEYGPQGVQFVGVAYKDVDSKAQAFLEEYGLGFPNGPDARLEISRAYRLRGVPETFIVGPDGVLVHHYIGPLDEAHFRQVMQRLLGGQ